MDVVVNGKKTTVAEASSLGDLLQAMTVDPRYVAIAVNYQCIPATDYTSHKLSAGDEVEILTPFAGG